MNIYKQNLDIFEAYINKLPLKTEFKTHILDKTFYKKTPEFYFYYPSVFAHAFPNVKSADVTLLNIATFLYYKYLMIEDRYVDKEKYMSHHSVTPNDTQKISILVEESMKILSHLFSIDSPFWDYWNMRRNEYLEGMGMDKRKAEIISLSDYERLADSRAAFAKAAIDGLYILNNQRYARSIHSDLITSHIYFTIALHLLDDIKDIVEDQKINQANLAYSELIRVLKKQDIDYKSLDITMIEKYLYVTGVAGRILQSAIHYFIKAKKPILNLELPIWFEIVEKQIEFAKGCLKTIDDYLDEIKIKVDSI